MHWDSGTFPVSLFDSQNLPQHKLLVENRRLYDTAYMPNAYTETSRNQEALTYLGLKPLVLHA